MSTQGETLRHPVNGSRELTWDGFSWPGFFLGVFWLLVKGLYGHFVINLLLVVITAGFAAPIVWVVYGIAGNGIHKNSLIEKGYLTETQWNDRNPKQAEGPVAWPLAKEAAEAAEIFATQASPRTRAPALIADELKKLSELRRDGVLTDDEFTQQKSALLRSAGPPASVAKPSLSSDDAGRSNAENMAKYGITFEGKNYRNATCRFDTPTEAIKYAQSVLKREA